MYIALNNGQRADSSDIMYFGDIYDDGNHHVLLKNGTLYQTDWSDTNKIYQICKALYLKETSQSDLCLCLVREDCYAKYDEIDTFGDLDGTGQNYIRFQTNHRYCLSKSDMDILQYAYSQISIIKSRAE